MSMRIVNVTLPSAHFNGESTLPSLYEMTNVQALTRSALDEDDGLFIGYGGLRSLFPYRMQDLYDRAEEPTVYVGIEFENRYLKALFLPALGGRLWSLYDKVAGRELLYRNPVVRPCNLAVRNAWLAGGIEFNCGMIGHHPFTCSQIFAAQTALDDGTPVLRMYEFERIRRCVYQMDFFLPEESRVLLGRMRIVNPNRETVPMYWWTNMAVRENPRARNVIDATVSYNNKGGIVGKNPVPVSGGTDITYPSRNPVAIDYFWKIPDAARKFTAYLDENGYGFCQTSTARLQGRKLFVWGQGEGEASGGAGDLLRLRLGGVGESAPRPRRRAADVPAVGFRAGWRGAGGLGTPAGMRHTGAGRAGQSLPACIVDVSARVDGARAGICRLSREAAASGGNRVGGWALA